MKNNTTLKEFCLRMSCASSVAGVRTWGAHACCVARSDLQSVGSDTEAAVKSQGFQAKVKVLLAHVLVSQEARAGSGAFRGNAERHRYGLSDAVDVATACHLLGLRNSRAMRPEFKGGPEGEPWENDLQPTDARNETAVLEAGTRAMGSMSGSAFSEGSAESQAANWTYKAAHGFVQHRGPPDRAR